MPNNPLPTPTAPPKPSAPPAKGLPPQAAPVSPAGGKAPAPLPKSGQVPQVKPTAAATTQGMAPGTPPAAPTATAAPIAKPAAPVSSTPVKPSAPLPPPGAPSPLKPSAPSANTPLAPSTPPVPPRPAGSPPGAPTGSGNVPPMPPTASGPLKPGAAVPPPPAGMPPRPPGPAGAQPPVLAGAAGAPPLPPTKPPVGMPPSAPGSPVPPRPGAPLPPVGGPPGTPAAKAAGPVAPAAAGTSAAPTPQIATIKKSPLRFVPLVLGALLLIGGVLFGLSRLLGFGSSTTPTTSQTATTNGSNNGSTTGNRTTVPTTQTKITYWGLWEPTPVLQSVIAEFEQANPGYKVEYVQQSHKNYRERLQTAVASGNGPDVYRFHASWTPMLKGELSPMPSSVMTTSEYQQTFYPVAFQQLSLDGQIVGIPLSYEGLALYYNKDILRNAGASPPTTWAELRTLATQLTVRSDTGGVVRGGMAIGNASNVEHFSDIIGLLMLQNGANPSDPTSKEAADAMTFYTNFVKNDKVWSDTLPSSTVAFGRGDVAMMLAPSWRAHEIKAINPNLSFGIAPVPKLGNDKVTWASYWAEGVSAQSKQKDAAWKFLDHMSSAAVQKKLYSAQSQVRSFGTPYSRVDLGNELATDPNVGAFISDAPSAKGWYLSSYTHDNGINDQMIKYYQDAVNAILGGTSVSEAMNTVDLGTAEVLRKYGVKQTQ